MKTESRTWDNQITKVWDPTHAIKDSGNGTMGSRRCLEEQKEHCGRVQAPNCRAKGSTKKVYSAELWLSVY